MGIQKPCVIGLCFSDKYIEVGDCDVKSPFWTIGQLHSHNTSGDEQDSKCANIKDCLMDNHLET